MQIFFIIVTAWLAEAYIYLHCDGGFAFFRLESIGGNTTTLGASERLRQLVFFTNYTVAISLLFLIPLLRWRWLRWVSIGLLWGAIGFELVYTNLIGRPPSFSDVYSVNLAMFTNLSDVVLEHSSTIWQVMPWLTALLPLPLLIGFMGRRRFSTRILRYSKLATLSGVLYLTFAYGIILYARGEPANIGFPKGFNYLIATLLMAPATRNLPETKLPLRRDPFAGLNKVIVIIDESIWGAAFWAPALAPTQYWLAKEKTFSLGNCSAASNFYLRKSVQMENKVYPTKSLFELAQTQGFTTTYIDTQGALHDPTTRNYFDAAELNFVQHQISLDTQYERHRRDDAALQALLKILRRPGKDFIILNKYGSHFPYEFNLAPAARHADRDANYRASVQLHSVDFLKTLAEALNPDAVVFYTSDHGQYVPGPATHCNSGDQSRREEWEVPMAVFSGNEVLIKRLRRPSGHLFTHAHFTESVRELLGYDFAEVDSFWQGQDHPVPASICLNYGPPLGFFGKAPNCQVYELF